MSIALALILAAVQDDTRHEAFADYYQAVADYTAARIEIDGVPPATDRARLEHEAMANALSGFQARAAKCGTSFVIPEELPSEPRLGIDPNATPGSVRCLKRSVPFATFKAK